MRIIAARELGKGEVRKLLTKPPFDEVQLNPKIRAFPVSAKTGEGMEAWENWLRDQLQTWRSH